MHTKLERKSDSTNTSYYFIGDVTTLRIDTFKALYDLAKNEDVPNYNLDML